MFDVLPQIAPPATISITPPPGGSSNGMRTPTRTRPAARRRIKWFERHWSDERRGECLLVVQVHHQHVSGLSDVLGRAEQSEQCSAHRLVRLVLHRARWPAST